MPDGVLDAARRGYHWCARYPLHFAFLFVLNLVIGMLTPPVGVLLFVVASARQIPVNTLVRNVYPFILVQLAVLALCIAFPPIVTWLPKQLGY